MNPKAQTFLKALEVLGTLVAGIALAVGVNLYAAHLTTPAGPAPVVQGAFSVPCYTNPGGAGVVADSGCTWNVKSGGTLQVDSGATESHAATETHTGAATFSGGLTIGTETVSGATRFGSATGVTTGTLIAHGFTTTPTAILLTAGSPVVSNTTVFIVSSNATSFTVGITGTTATITTLNWMAGK